MVLMVVVIVAVLIAIGIGWLWIRGDGAVRPGSGERIRAADAALPDTAFGPRATLLLFTSPQDPRGPAVRGILEELAARTPGARVAEVDLAARGELAGRFAVTTTPSVFVLDGEGRLRFRIKGAGRPDETAAALASVAPPG